MTSTTAAPRFTLVGHAHIDPVWLWTWREGHETVKATFRSALDRLRENPDLVFVHSSTAQYAWMEGHPRLLTEIREAVTRGQWEPVGGWWVEPDVNLPGGEALARQALVGQRELRRLVGRDARVGFLPDSFGHPPTLPMLLRESGLTSLVFMRPSASEIELPCNLFRWRGPDGRELLTARVECYNTSPLQVESSLARGLKWRPERLQEWMHLFGVGNHGGGPTKRAIQNVRDLNADPAWPELGFGSLEDFLTRAATLDNPAYEGELQHHARGCYAAHAEIKRLNRRAEHALLAAERLAVLAGTEGHAYPAEDLTRAWKRVLFNQFHDILAGSSIQSAYDDARDEMGEALGIAHRVAFAAAQALADTVDTRRAGRDADEAIRSTRWSPEGWVSDYGDGVPVLAFNPTDHERTETLEVEINDWHTTDLRLLDHEEREVPYQLVQPESASGGRPRVAFTARVPALGHALYRVVDEPASFDLESLPELEASDTHLQNTWWRLEIDPVTGTLRRLIDRARGIDLLAGAGAQLLVTHDPTDTWGHGAVHLRHLAGVFGEPEVRRVEHGAVRATLRVKLRYGNSTAVQDLTLQRDTPEILGRTTVDWHERHRALQLAFPLAISGVTATYEVPYGHAVRPATGEEEPVGRWLDVSGTARDQRGAPRPAGATLFTDGVASASTLGGDLRLTLLRSAAYAHHDPAKLDPGTDYAWQDQGRHVVRWALRLHAGALDLPATIRRAEDHNTELLFTREFVHAGHAPQRASHLAATGADHVVVTALKPAEDDPATLVVRLHETAGRAGTFRATLLGREVTWDLYPHEVVTLLVTDGGITRANFVEDAGDVEPPVERPPLFERLR